MEYVLQISCDGLEWVRQSEEFAPREKKDFHKKCIEL